MFIEFDFIDSLFHATLEITSNKTFYKNKKQLFIYTKLLLNKCELSCESALR